MQLFMREFADKVDAVDLSDPTIKPPQLEVQDGERVVGILGDDMRKFYITFLRYVAELKKRCEVDHPLIRMAARKPQADLTADDIALGSQHHLLHERVKLIAKMFFYGVRERFPEAADENLKVCLRKNWQVTVTSWRDDPVDELMLTQSNGH